MLLRLCLIWLLAISLVCTFSDMASAQNVVTGTATASGTALVRTQTLTPNGNLQGTFAFTDIPLGRYNKARNGCKGLSS